MKNYDLAARGDILETPMYEVDGRDEVGKLPDLPQSSIGAPTPFIISDERIVVLAYYLEEQDPEWDGQMVRVLGPTAASEPVAIVRFALCYAHMSGPPNDEAYSGHPLASRGVRPYDAFEVRHSSWIRRLERMNSVHRHHKPDRFWNRRHFIFAFHDTTFECVADGFDLTISHGSIESVIPEMLKQLHWSPGV
jgi:hypothetical protein